MNDPRSASSNIPPVAEPVRPPTRREPPAPRRTGMGCLMPLVLVMLFVSLLGNVLLGLLLTSNLASSLDVEPSKLDEKYLLGDKEATDKIAVVRLEGVISDAATHYPIKQMEKAAKDRHVKAVVLRIDSPGGAVTASEELYQCVVNLRDNNERRFTGSGPKPVSVSMGGVAASGGYYVAAAGKPIAAEQTTITGSIGVFAALPNAAGFLADHKLKVELIKAGDIKASGSFFNEMSQEERQTWQDVVDDAYSTFLDRVAAGRPGLKKEQVRDELVVDRMVQERDSKGNPVLKDGKPVMTRYTRKRADGGTYTAEQALKFGLIDKVEDLPATIRAAAAAAGLSKFKAVEYRKPHTLMELLSGGEMESKQAALDLRGLSSSLTPRLWYLAPTTDGAILTPAR